MFDDLLMTADGQGPGADFAEHKARQGVCIDTEMARERITALRCVEQVGKGCE